MQINGINALGTVNNQFKNLQKGVQKSATQHVTEPKLAQVPLHAHKNLLFGRNLAEHKSWGATFDENKNVNFKVFTFSDAKDVYIEVLDKNAKENTDDVDARDILVDRLEDDTVQNISSVDKKSKMIKLDKKGDGVFEITGQEGIKNGDKYRLIIVKGDNVIEKVKDPYAKKQPHIMGWSEIYDQNAYKWNDADWQNGKNPARITRQNGKINSLRIYELNIPTITKKGDFESAKAVFKEIKDKNLANAVEIMPVENTYSKQWGYDGVDKFAVNEKLGGADALKDLINYAHEIGLNVIIDMVPNHMGPDGDMMKRTGPYERGDGSFGSMFNFEGKDNRYVRDWMANIALMWAQDFHADGIRFDMTKPDYMGSDFTLKQITTELNEHNPDVFTIAEDGMGNRHKVTTPLKGLGSHQADLDKLDHQVDKIYKGQGIEQLDDLGFDSEWDFVLLHELEKGLRGDVDFNMDSFNSAFLHSGQRVKYNVSHDEIGNMDGTSSLVKFATAKLNLYNNIKGSTPAQVGQRAAHATHGLMKLYATGELDKMSDDEFNQKVDSFGITRHMTKQELKDAYDLALNKTKLALGTIFSAPGPKMFFQGAENGGLDYFKFFRKFSSQDGVQSEQDIANKERMDAEKGYDTSYEAAFQDSVVGNIKCTDEVKKKMQQAEQYTIDLSNFHDSNEAMKYGEIVHAGSLDGTRVHTTHLRKGDDEVFCVKNLTEAQHTNLPIYFPQGKWVEVINTDDKKYAGEGKYLNPGIYEGKGWGTPAVPMNIGSNDVTYFKRIA